VSSPSMKDVARRAGVSQSTVSRVLNDAPTAIAISPATQARVLKAARELGYTPNPLARGLRGSRTGLLGLIVREIDDPFFAQLIDVITMVTRERGYSIVLGHARSNSDEALALSDILDLRHCDGLFVLGEVRGDQAFFARIVESNPTVVAFCSGEPVGGISVVDVDNRKGIYLALDYLVGLGHRKIAFIEGGWIGATLQRRETFLEYMQQHSLEIPQEYIAQVEANDASGGYRGMKSLLDIPDPPTAVLASDDAVAIGALKAAFDLGFQVPADVSVIGFDDIEATSYTIPALTTIRQPVEEMAQKAVDVLFDMLDGKISPDDVSPILTEPAIVIRDSCAPPRTR